jgi:CheY-like chemotaxis protein
MVESRPSVLCVDGDRDIAETVQAILTDEGYTVSCLYDLTDDQLMRAVGRLEPDVILLDSANPEAYSPAWELARTIHERSRPVPVVMFTAHLLAVQEAEAAESERATAAHFAAVLPKPFHLDDLLRAVASATKASIPFDRTRAGESARTRALVAALKQQGATDVRPSAMREWAMFRDRQDALVQFYWWQIAGVYLVGRYDEEGILKLLGQVVDRDAAIELALPRELP